MAVVSPPPGRTRFGLLGTGPWAELTQAPALRTHPDVEFVGVWGRRPEAAEALAARFDTRPYRDVDALLADCDAVAVALPPDVQAPFAVRAAEAGRHLLLDKPVATTVAGARRVVQAVDAAGVASVVFFTLHFDARTAEWLREQAAAGEWFTARAEWITGLFNGSDSPFAASPWRRERGALWDVGPHALSVLLRVLGDVTEPVPVAVAAGPGDTVHLTLRHVGGASSTLTVTHTAPLAAAGEAVELRGGGGVARLPAENGEDGPVGAFTRAVHALCQAARGGPAHPCDVRFGLRVTEILGAAEDALATQPR